MSSQADTSNLTPIKIPGKRHRKPAGGDEPNKRRQPGRPRKEEKKKQRVVSRRPAPQPRRLEHLKSQNQMSSFEKLPTEVLENIYLHSMNYNLPRSSPVLAGRLSSNYIFIETIINVFRDPWKGCFMNHIDYDLHQSIDEQTDLLKLKWATVPLLQEARGRWLTRSYSFFLPEQVANKYIDVKDDFLARHPEYEDSTNWPDTLEATLHIEEDTFTHYHSVMVRNARPFDDNGDPQLCRATFGDGLPYIQDLNPPSYRTAYPPERVLKGPWSQDKLLHLFWMSWAGVSLSFADSTILPEVASQGLQDAIREGNLHAISLLQLLDMQQLVHEDIFNALAATQAPNKAIIIVRVLDLFFCSCQKSSPKGTWEHWVEDIIKMSAQEKGASERRQLMRALRAEVYDYARTAYKNATEVWSGDQGNTERLTDILSR